MFRTSLNGLVVSMLAPRHLEHAFGDDVALISSCRRRSSWRARDQDLGDDATHGAVLAEQRAGPVIGVDPRRLARDVAGRQLAQRAFALRPALLPWRARRRSIGGLARSELGNLRRITGS
jgi:hypothetical protein